MNRKGVVIALVLIFGLAAGAGVMVGRFVVEKLSAGMSKDAVPLAPVAHRGTLAEELQLTPEQSRQMQKIWEGVNIKSNQWVTDAKAIQVDEDKELLNQILKTDEQKKAFQDLRIESARKLDLLERDRKSAFDKAVDDTTKLLNEDQRRIYRQIIKDKTGSLPDPAGGGASQGWSMENGARASR